MGNKILTVEDINVYYGAIHAVKGVSFDVEEGDIVTLIGANGAGKSTTLQTVSGLLRSKTGSISFLDENITKLAPHKILKRGLAQVPEGSTYIPADERTGKILEMGAFTRRLS